MSKQYRSVPEMLRALGDKDAAAWIEAKQPEKEPLIECICKLAKRLDEVIAFCEAPASTQEKADTQNAILYLAKGESDE